MLNNTKGVILGYDKSYSPYRLAQLKFNSSGSYTFSANTLLSQTVIENEEKSSLVYYALSLGKQYIYRLNKSTKTKECTIYKFNRDQKLVGRVSFNLTDDSGSVIGFFVTNDYLTVVTTKFITQVYGIGRFYNFDPTSLEYFGTVTTPYDVLNTRGNASIDSTLVFPESNQCAIICGTAATPKYLRIDVATGNIILEKGYDYISATVSITNVVNGKVALYSDLIVVIDVVTGEIIGRTNTYMTIGRVFLGDDGLVYFTHDGKVKTFDAYSGTISIVSDEIPGLQGHGLTKYITHDGTNMFICSNSDFKWWWFSSPVYYYSTAVSLPIANADYPMLIFDGPYMNRVVNTNNEGVDSFTVLRSVHNHRFSFEISSIRIISVDVDDIERLQISISVGVTALFTIPYGDVIQEYSCVNIIDGDNIILSQDCKFTQITPSKVESTIKFGTVITPKDEPVFYKAHVMDVATTNYEYIESNEFSGEKDIYLSVKFEPKSINRSHTTIRFSLNKSELKTNNSSDTIYATSCLDKVEISHTFGSEWKSIVDFSIKDDNLFVNLPSDVNLDLAWIKLSNTQYGLTYTITKLNNLVEDDFIGDDFIDANGDGKHDYDNSIIVPDEYYDTTNLKLYIERRYRDKWSNNILYNYYDIRIANPIEGGTPWYNLKPTSNVLKVNWNAKYSSTGEVICTGNTVTKVTNEGWTIGGRININIPTSYLDSSNRATLILEVETPTGEWIVSDKFQINNYSNEYNYKWRFDGEDDNYIYFVLDGDYSLTNGWYKPDYVYLYDGEERITSYMSKIVSVIDNVATMKVSKTSTDIENIPKHGYWCHSRCPDYTLSSAPKGYGGVEKFEFTVKLQIRTTTISQNKFEVIQQNNKIYIANAYFTENVEVYKDGVKLECSYDKDSGEIKFILPSDTPKEIKGHTLNLQYKVFYNDNDEIKSFTQDFTYTTYASYFVEFDPDFEDYYWEQINSYPPIHNNYSLSNGTFAYHKGYLYLTGSYYFDGEYQKKLYRYTIENDKWIELTGPSYDTFRTHPIVYDNKIYYIGGVTYSNYEYLSKVQIYDIESDTWSYGTDCPRNQGPREFQPILYNSKIYCFSGYCNDYPSPKSLMHIYDIESDSWETIDTPYSLRNYSATCIDGKIYICDGADSSYNYITTLYVYDIEANEWTTGPDKPVYPYGGQADGGTMLNKFVSILGYPGESIKTMSFVYDIQKDEWMRLPDAPDVLGYTYDYPLCVTDDSELYVMKYNYFYRLTKPKVTYSDSYLYEYEGKYYTESEKGELIETTTQELTDDLFAIEGVYSINSDLIKPNMKVLYYKVENKDVVPQVKYSGVYEGATITMDWDLQSEQGKTFNVLGDVYSDDNVRFLLSNNKGQSWLTFNGYEVVSCDINNIKDNGMTYDVFTSLIPSQLQSFKGGTNSLRIAIYIEQYSVNGKTNIDHIRLRY